MRSTTPASRMSTWWTLSSWSRSARASARLASEPVDRSSIDVDRVALGQQAVDEGRPDEPGAAGDERLHADASGIACRRRSWRRRRPSTSSPMTDAVRDARAPAPTIGARRRRSESRTTRTGRDHARRAGRTEPLDDGAGGDRGPGADHRALHRAVARWPLGCTPVLGRPAPARRAGRGWPAR